MRNRHPLQQRTRLLAGAAVVSLTIALWWASASPAAASQPAETGNIRSTFVLPTNPKEGRDPFYPASNRPYEAAAALNPHVADVTSLVLRGISGPPGHRLVIINNHTFATGDEGDVLTIAGRLRLRCIEIRDKSVVIETGDQRHVLTYPAGY